MTTRAAVNEFLGQRTLALVGVSRSGKKFGNAILKDLAAKGLKVFPVHPEADEIDGVTCYPSLAALPEKVQAVVIVVPPQAAIDVIREAAAAGIRHVWLQQGAESRENVALAQSLGLNVVAGECIMMFAEPAAWFHRMHRGFKGLIGRLPR